MRPVRGLEFAQLSRGTMRTTLWYRRPQPISEVPDNTFSSNLSSTTVPSGL